MRTQYDNKHYAVFTLQDFAVITLVYFYILDASSFPVDMSYIYTLSLFARSYQAWYTSILKDLTCQFDLDDLDDLDDALGNNHTDTNSLTEPSNTKKVDLFTLGYNFPSITAASLVTLSYHYFLHDSLIYIIQNHPSIASALIQGITNTASYISNFPQNNPNITILTLLTVGNASSMYTYQGYVKSHGLKYLRYLSHSIARVEAESTNSLTDQHDSIRHIASDLTYGLVTKLLQSCNTPQAQQWMKMYFKRPDAPALRDVLLDTSYDITSRVVAAHELEDGQRLVDSHFRRSGRSLNREHDSSSELDTDSELSVSTIASDHLPDSPNTPDAILSHLAYSIVTQYTHKLGITDINPVLATLLRTDNAMSYRDQIIESSYHIASFVSHESGMDPTNALTLALFNRHPSGITLETMCSQIAYEYANNRTLHLGIPHSSDVLQTVFQIGDPSTLSQNLTDMSYALATTATTYSSIPNTGALVDALYQRNGSDASAEALLREMAYEYICTHLHHFNIPHIRDLMATVFNLEGSAELRTSLVNMSYAMALTLARESQIHGAQMLVNSLYQHGDHITPLPLALRHVALRLNIPRGREVRVQNYHQWYTRMTNDTFGTGTNPSQPLDVIRHTVLQMQPTRGTAPSPIMQWIQADDLFDPTDTDAELPETRDENTSILSSFYARALDHYVPKLSQVIEQTFGQPHKLQNKITNNVIIWSIAFCAMLLTATVVPLCLFNLISLSQIANVAGMLLISLSLILSIAFTAYLSTSTLIPSPQYTPTTPLPSSSLPQPLLWSPVSSDHARANEKDASWISTISSTLSFGYL